MRKNVPAFRLKMNLTVSVVVEYRRRTVRLNKSGEMTLVNVNVKTEKKKGSVLSGYLEEFGILALVNVSALTL